MSRKPNPFDKLRVRTESLDSARDKLRRSAKTEARTPQLIVALDVGTLKEEERLLKLLYPQVKIFKIGIQLFTKAGPQAVKIVKDFGARVFLDLKFYDIPHIVAEAMRQVVDLGVFMCTLHIQAGQKTLKAAVDAAKKQAVLRKKAKPLILGVTVLTSERQTSNMKQLVLERARIAKASGLDGVVASVQEAQYLRQRLPRNFLIVTPGIRLKQDSGDDQRRISDPKSAALAGVDFIVVGRPITQARNPKKTAQQIMRYGDS